MTFIRSPYLFASDAPMGPWSNGPVTPNGGRCVDMNKPKDSLIASRLTSGALRRDEPVKTRFAKGWEGDCAGCQAAITMTHFASETVFNDQVTLRFHRDCYYAWHAARGPGILHRDG